MSADDGIHATGDHNNIGRVEQNTSKPAQGGHSEQMAWNDNSRCNGPP
jgi:hypothetical protein